MFDSVTVVVYREKETVLLYLKSVQKGLEENKAAIKQSRQGFYDLSKFLLSDAKLGTQGLPVGATLLACQVRYCHFFVCLFVCFVHLVMFCNVYTHWS